MTPTPTGQPSTATASQEPPAPLFPYVLLACGTAAATAALLYWMGQVPICKCGYIRVWHGVVFSSENSQHLSDWYTFSHIIHGFLFYGLLWLVGRRWPLGARLVIATVLEASWEVFENTDFIINRYREVTIALDYYGDSVLNSVSDIFAMMSGFVVAARLPVRCVVALGVAMELVVGYLIRDNLALNIIMLIYPIESIKQWQSAPTPLSELVRVGLAWSGWS